MIQWFSHKAALEDTRIHIKWVESEYVGIPSVNMAGHHPLFLASPWVGTQTLDDT